MYIFIDYDKSRDKGIIKSDFLKNIREHFSIADDKAELKKRMLKSSGKANFIQDRKYIISEQGRFDVGFIVEILRYLKSLNIQFKIVFGEEFKKRYHCAYDWSGEPLVDLAIPYRDYQIEGIRKGLANGNGIILVQTGGGKSLMMAGIIMNVLKRNPNAKVLVVTLTHLMHQIYEEFLSYGINPQIISKWGDSEELNKTSNIIISGSNIVTSKIENTALELKKAKVVYLTLKKDLENDIENKIPQAKRLQMLSQIERIEKDIPKISRRNDANQKIHDFLETVDLLVVDEIHSFKKDNEISNLVKYIPSRNRYGFTGTMPESLIDQWSILGTIGPIVFETPRDMLVERKFITDVDVRILQLWYNDEPDYLDMEFKNSIGHSLDDDDGDDEKPTSRYLAELDHIYKSKFRNNIIRKITEKLTKNTLIVLDHLSHGEHLLEYLTASLPHKKVYFIRGEMEVEDRQKIQKLMEIENNIVCIAISKIFSTGINIKNLHYIIFASAGKAKVRTIQTIGRGVRMIEGKEKVVIFDLADMLHYGKRHLQKRKQLYDTEQFKYQFTDIKESEEGT